MENSITKDRMLHGAVNEFIRVIFKQIIEENNLQLIEPTYGGGCLSLINNDQHYRIDFMLQQTFNLISVTYEDLDKSNVKILFYPFFQRLDLYADQLLKKEVENFPDFSTNQKKDSFKHAHFYNYLIKTRDTLIHYHPEIFEGDKTFLIDMRNMIANFINESKKRTEEPIYLNGVKIN